MSNNNLEHDEGTYTTHMHNKQSPFLDFFRGFLLFGFFKCFGSKMTLDCTLCVYAYWYAHMNTCVRARVYSIWIISQHFFLSLLLRFDELHFRCSSTLFCHSVCRPEFLVLFTHSKFHANVKTHNKQIQNTLCRLKIRAYLALFPFALLLLSLIGSSVSQRRRRRCLLLLSPLFLLLFLLLKWWHLIRQIRFDVF